MSSNSAGVNCTGSTSGQFAGGQHDVGLEIRDKGNFSDYEYFNI
jgi:hypothetical protein